MTPPPESSKRWEALIWPRWLPIPGRLPLIAQISGLALLIAAFAMPTWSVETPPPADGSSPPGAAPAPVDATQKPSPPTEPPRPAHLNLDVRHAFGSLDLSVSIDDKRVLDTTLEGSRKRFGVVGKRTEKNFTKTLDLAPGARVVRVRVRSARDKFDQTRVERFDLGPASVATLRINAEKSGLLMVAERPTDGQEATLPPPATQSAEPVAQHAQKADGAGRAVEVAEAGAYAELYRTLQSTLIAVAGFIASVASGFLFEEYLRSRNLSLFPQSSSPSSQFVSRAERRRRARRPRNNSDISIDAGPS